MEFADFQAHQTGFNEDVLEAIRQLTEQTSVLGNAVAAVARQVDSKIAQTNIAVETVAAEAAQVQAEARQHLQAFDGRFSELGRQIMLLVDQRFRKIESDIRQSEMESRFADLDQRLSNLCSTVFSQFDTSASTSSFDTTLAHMASILQGSTDQDHACDTPRTPPLGQPLTPRIPRTPPAHGHVQAEEWQHPVPGAKLARVIRDFIPEDDVGMMGTLAVREGEYVYILDRDLESGWAGGHRQGDDDTGWFPAAFVEEAPTSWRYRRFLERRGRAPQRHVLAVAAPASRYFCMCSAMEESQQELDQDAATESAASSSAQRWQ